MAPAPPVPSASAPSASAPSASAPVAAVPAIEPGPAVVERFEVPGDRPASIVKSADGRPPRLVFFPGICSNGGAYLYGFAEAARAHGGAIAIDGDRPCGNLRDFSSITSDPDHEEPRFYAALRAAGVADPQNHEVILVGYSLGATLIENLVKKSPERYPRVILIGSPRDPRLDRLQGARAVVTMSCSQDVPGRMKGASKRLTAAGIASMYLEMPRCTHGHIEDGDRVFGEAFSWLDGIARDHR
ncbi:MAG: alpha/beta hydrolase [Polyangiaceae bacterium]|nr:alpha/beta hydrolase [Polyangiaceae bacterium]